MSGKKCYHTFETSMNRTRIEPLTSDRKLRPNYYAFDVDKRGISNRLATLSVSKNDIHPVNTNYTRCYHVILWHILMSFRYDSLVDDNQLKVTCICVPFIRFVLSCPLECNLSRRLNAASTHKQTGLADTLFANHVAAVTQQFTNIVIHLKILYNMQSPMRN